MKRLDAFIFEGSNKKAGKAITSFREVYSKDGKTLTVTVTGTNSQGNRFDNVEVFEKQ